MRGMSTKRREAAVERSKAVSSHRTPKLVGAVFEAGDAFVLGAVGATIHFAAGFVAVADDAAAAMRALGREHMDGAFEAIEVMRNAVAHDLDRLVVLVAATFTSVRAGMKRGLGVGREFWF